jgi:serine/threonine-protein kinase SRPK3
MTPPIYEECFLERVENVQKYQAGGFHPISVGQIMKGGPYEIVHKLGYGGIATVWLARDLAPDCGNRALGPLVCLKVISATHSLDAIEASAEVEIPPILLGTSAIDDETRHFIRTHILHNDEPFIEHGPNGSHLCVVSEIAGPSISDVYSNAHVTGRTLGSVRLRADLALKIAGQVARFVHAMHTAGCVHGGKQQNYVDIGVILTVIDRSEGIKRFIPSRRWRPKLDLRKYL